MNQPKGDTESVALVNRSDPYNSRASYSNKPYGFESPDSQNSDGVVVEYWRIIRRNAKTVFTASVAGLIIGFAIGIPMKPVYRARTSLEVLTLNEDFMNMKQANPTTTTDSSDEISEEQTQAKLLESTALLERVITHLDQGDKPGENGKVKLATSGWRKWLHLPENRPVTPRRAALASAASTLKVRPTARTRVLEVTIDSTDAALASDFANTLCQEFIAQNMEARWNTTQRTSEWLRRELDDARSKLRASEDALQSYARGSGLIFTDEATNVATEKLEQVQQSLSGATTDRIAKQSRFELAQNSPPDSLADVLNDSSLRETQSKINDLRRQIADLSAVFNPEYSKIQRLHAELESLQGSFDRSRADILVRIKNDFQEAKRREALLAAAYNSQAREVTGQDEKAIQYNILKRDVDSNRQLYDTMLQQMKQASIASAMRASNVRVVDPAELSYMAVSPNFKLNSAVGLILGLFLSIGFVTIRERADQTFQQPGEIRTWLDLLELGVVPSAALDGERNFYRPRTTALADAPDHQGRDTVELATFQKKPSLIAEAFRSTLTSILFVGENGSRPQVLVFTSANAADGKTTVASNLAIAAAEIRCKVLVIDADLRRPKMHRIFDVPNEHGLSDILRGDFSEDSVAQRICPTKVENLHLLPAGPPTNAAAHLLYSPNFARMLTGLREKYDMIFIDTPPMLQMTDARVTGRLADAVVLIVRAGRTTRDAMLAAKARLNEDRTRVLGTVLNEWNPKTSRGGYYGYYQGSGYYTNYVKET